jgi:type IV pilus assembly protein PilA
MLIKMKESKGFTLVELMIVVAIIGILAAVAVPFYQRYIQKSRLTSLVFPGVHSIQTNIGTYYSFKQRMPVAASILDMTGDADTGCFTPSITGGATTPAIQILISATLNDAQTRCRGLAKLDGMTMVATPVVINNKITSWALSGGLATRLGLGGEGG